MSDEFEDRRSTTDIYLSLSAAIRGVDGIEQGNMLEALRQLIEDDPDDVRALLVQAATALALYEKLAPDALLQKIIEEYELASDEAWEEFRAEVEVYDLSKLYMASSLEEETPTDEEARDAQ